MPTTANEKISFEVKFVQMFFFQSGSVIVSSIPEIILLSNTNTKNISTFLNTFSIIKQLLSSYEVNIKLATIEKLLCRRLKSSEKTPCG